MTDIMDIWLHAHNMLRSARQMINKNLRPLNLGSAEGNIMVHLWSHAEEMAQEQLVKELDISKPAVSRALDSLETKGFITRHSDPSDKRAYLIKMTNKALEIGPEIEQIYNDIYLLAVRGISKDEIEYFIALFSRISQNFDQDQMEE